MRIGARVLPSVVAVAVALLLPEAVAQDDYRLKPGATGQVCLDCHVGFEDTLKMASVHTPVAGGDCTGCHNPHASAHGNLLGGAPDQVCGECHEGLVPDQAQSSHPAALSGDCLVCHDAHATDNPNVLIASGNDLCAECHGDIADATAKARFKHNPVTKGCLNCHDAHASTEGDFLLRDEDPALCLECHDTDRASFAERHMGYPVERGQCSSCHDPHGSSSPGMLWATVHRPIDTKMCGQCHLDPSSPEALQTKASGAELCRTCHSSMVNETLARVSVHGPMTDRMSCQHCHSPHASKHAGLLPARLDLVCGKCHADTLARIRHAEFKHVPVEAGECMACHAPHSSNNDFLLLGENSIELCGECHDWESHSTHPIGEDVQDMRNTNLTVDCLSCHYSHGSDHKYLAPLDAASGLCVDCHEQLGR